MSEKIQITTQTKVLRWIMVVLLGIAIAITLATGLSTSKDSNGPSSTLIPNSSEKAPF